MTPTPSLSALIARLARHSILEAEDVSAIAQLPHRNASVERSTILLRQGQVEDSVVVFRSGYACSAMSNHRGQELITSFHLRGDAVGVQISPGAISNYSVRTISRCEVTFIPQRALEDLFNASPRIASALWRDVIVDASALRQRLLAAGGRRAIERIAHLLCELAYRQAMSGIATGPVYELPMSQEEIGQAAGLTSVHVNRMLRDLKARKCIDYGNKTFTILEPKTLRDIAVFDSAYLDARAPTAAE